MHIPDGFLDVTTSAIAGGASVVAVGVALKEATRELKERTIPVLGVTAAFLFAAQMVNFPVAAGTSGHFLGAALATALLGPWAGIIVMTAVVAVQALALADGGIAVLGANVLNMAVIGCMVSFVVVAAGTRLSRGSRTGFLASVAVGSWLSIVVPSAAASLELATSGTVPLGVTLPAMVTVHAVIGLAEALIATSVVAVVLRSRPDLVSSFRPARAAGSTEGAPVPVPLGEPSASRASAAGFRRRAPRRGWSFAAVGLIVAVAVGVFVAPFASSSPDGLEKVAEDKGFMETAVDSATARSPFADYGFPGLEGRTATAAVGAFGCLLLFSVVLVLGRVLSRKEARNGRRSPLPDR